MLFRSQNKWRLVLLFGIYLESLKAEQVLSNPEDSLSNAPSNALKRLDNDFGKIKAIST